jgi:NAD(P)-dependent dehydrogenase (short-subunit alcohol dehydrogenase family)
MSFAKRVALITGAGRGIGRQLTFDLIAAGASVAGVDLDAEPLAELATQLSGKSFVSAVADVTDRAALVDAVGRLSGQLGPIDLLIASAGIGRQNPALGFSAETFADQIRVNLIGVANSVEAVLPGMIERRHGHLVALSSLASYRGLPRMAGYCASKAGVNALMDSLRIELEPHGIATTVICPGWIRTRMTENIDVKTPGILDTPVATRLMLDAIRRRQPYCGFPRQSLWRVRLLRWLPTTWSDGLVRRMLVRHEKVPSQ